MQKKKLYRQKTENMRFAVTTSHKPTASQRPANYCQSKHDPHLGPFYVALC